MHKNVAGGWSGLFDLCFIFVTHKIYESDRKHLRFIVERAEWKWWIWPRTFIFYGTSTLVSGTRQPSHGAGFIKTLRLYCEYRFAFRKGFCYVCFLSIQWAHKISKSTDTRTVIAISGIIQRTDIPIQYRLRC